MSVSHEAKPIVRPVSSDCDAEIEVLDYSATPSAVLLAATGPAFRRMPAARLALVVGGGLAVILALGTLANYSLLARSPVDSSSAAAQELTQSEETETVLAQESAPVRFVNPFDKGEVFEFPSGTTREEARDAVAELLRARAMERRRPAEAPKNRAARLP